MEPWLDIAMNQHKELWIKYVDNDMEFVQMCNFWPVVFTIPLFQKQEPAKVHPLQVNEIRGPKGGYHMKKLKNGYYLRIDMPGIKSDDFVVDTDEEQAEIRFRGVVKRVFTRELSKKDSERYYAVTVKVHDDCHNFSKIMIDHQFKDGVGRVLMTGIDFASLHCQTPKYARTSASSSSPAANDYNYHPYSVKIDGVRAENEHSSGCGFPS